MHDMLDDVLLCSLDDGWHDQAVSRPQDTLHIMSLHMNVEPLSMHAQGQASILVLRASASQQGRSRIIAGKPLHLIYHEGTGTADDAGEPHLQQQFPTVQGAHHIPEVLLRGGHADLEPGQVCCVSWKGVPVVKQGVEVAGVSCQVCCSHMRTPSACEQ